MGVNCEYLATAAGIFRILTIIFVGSSAGLAAYSHFESYYIYKVREEVLIGVTSAFFGLSLFYLLAEVGSASCNKSDCNKALGVIYHVVASVILIITGVLVVDSTLEINRTICSNNKALWPFSVPCQRYEGKLISSMLSIFSGALYAVSSFLIILSSNRSNQPHMKPKRNTVNF